MGRLIDEQTAYDVLTEYYHQRTDTQHKALEEALSRVPTAGAIQVVRCKECRWRKDKSGSTAWMPCRALITPNDFYCPSGERKDGDHEQDKKS